VGQVRARSARAGVACAAAALLLTSPLLCSAPPLPLHITEAQFIEHGLAALAALLYPDEPCKVPRARARASTAPRPAAQRQVERSRRVP